MEEDIKILEDYLLGKKMQYESGYTYFKEFKAIENLIKGYKEMENALKQIGANLEILDISGCKEIIQELLGDEK